MLYFGSVLRRIFRRDRVSKRVVIECLESRQMLSSAPAFTGIHLVGSVHDVVGVVLSFNESLDPTAAQDVNTFQFGRVPPQSSSSGVSLGDILPFLGRPKLQAVKLGKIQWGSARYDDASHTVTLTPIKAINAQKFFRVLRIKASGPHALKDPAGDVFNAGTDLVIRWTKRQGKMIRYVDRDGDIVILKLRGPGQIYAFTRRVGDPDPNPTIFIDRAQSRTVLTGVIHQSALGNGTVNIAELEGAGGITNNLSAANGFNVESIEP
jgi:hypothetical protein